MQLLSTHPDCPQEIVDSLAAASCLSDAFEPVRALAYHADCFVSLQRCLRSGRHLAVKAYTKCRLSQTAREQVDTETQVHASLMHDHVVQLLVAAEDDRCIYLLVKWADGGDLRQHLVGINERRLRDFVIRPMLETLAHLHDMGVVHRDIKPDNILVDHGCIKLADFGLAVYCPELDAQQPIMAQLPEPAQHPHAACTVAARPVVQHTHSPFLNVCSASSVSSGQSSADLCLNLSAAATVDADPEESTWSSVLSPTDCSAMSLSVASSWGSQQHHHLQLLAHAHTDSVVMVAAGCGSRGACGAEQQHLAPTLSCRNSPPPLLQRSPSSQALMSAVNGTPLYAAPELLRAMFDSKPIHEVVNHKNDVWALGVLALEALTGAHPFTPGGVACTSGDAMCSIAGYTALRSLPSSVSAQCASFLRAAMQRDPAARPTAQQLLLHPWFMEQYSLPCSPKAYGAGAAAAAACGLLEDVSLLRGCKTSAGGAVVVPVQPRGSSGGAAAVCECWEY